MGFVRLSLKNLTDLTMKTEFGFLVKNQVEVAKPVRVTDLVEMKRILKAMCKENDIDYENVFINKTYGYIETLDYTKKDVDFCRIVYDGWEYDVRYVSGCFNPYLFKSKV